MANNHDDNDPMGLTLSPEIRAELTKYAQEKLALGWKPERVRAEGKLVLDKLLEEAPEYAPAGMDDKTRAALNLQRACSAQRPLSRNPADETNESSTYRASTAKEIARDQLAAGCGLDDTASDNERAPRGWHPARLARENLERACNGLPTLLPHPDDE